ncbi:hypothetical protein NA57DRAFT_51487 [Rhizodiscina lignyota]|uniref:Uncharacterized protein n=1 Tax=Rhizodiscina lignyota TaxID=1504668 RepID=A0A9P4IRV3_9PEZI|nr:hypothetical protein NA57DRAFT_51487 [Rhizodiscina lignyota]
MTSPFPQDSRSPLLTSSHSDRKPQSPFTSGQPPSFKTNVNRAKTKKWVEAKAYSYEGDDWGDYDEDDEYGVETPPPQPQKATGLRQRGQSVEGQASASGGRSFTNPVGMPTQNLNRSNSFEKGDERRTFSAGTQPPPGYGEFPQMSSPTAQYGPPPGAPGRAPLQVQTDVQPRQRGDSVATSSSRYPSAGGFAQSAASEVPSSIDYTNRRDFSPSAMPAPLQSRTPQPGTPQDSADTPQARFPPRKSSLSQPNSPTSPTRATPADAGPRQQTPTNTSKQLPFIRPADIYKRMEEERARERASQESNRPSMDSILRPGEDARSGTPRERTSLDSVREEGGSSTSSSHLRATPLATVAERKSEYGLPSGTGEAMPAPRTAEPTNRPSETAQSGAPTLPQFTHDSDFGSGLWGTSHESATEHRDMQPEQQTDTGLQHQPSLGFRSAVQHAFERPDDEKSVPDTPMSKQSSLRSAPTGSDMSRSNTDSTAGISPIMSRVPSVGAAAAARANTQVPAIDLSQTPAIAEEPGENSRPVSMSIPRKPSPAHSREGSAGSAAHLPGHRHDLNTPPSRGSPARSPAIEAQKDLPEPEVAKLAIESEGSPQFASPETREADLAESVNKASIRPGSEESLEAAETAKGFQTGFLDSHKDMPLSIDTKRPESPAKSRSQSPSKSRVQELAGRFDDIAESNSRRNSSHSIGSRGSGKQGAETIEIPAERPSMESKPSFRPQLPGQWESFSTSRPDSTPNDSDVERDLHDNEPPGITYQEAVVSEKEPTTEEIDLTPTTSRHPLSAREAKDESPSIATNPMAALAAAGTAMGEAFKASVGMGDPVREAPPSSDVATEDFAPSHEPDYLSPTKRETGNIFARPLAPDRMESTVSTIPPTPPPKDGEVAPLDQYGETSDSAEDMPPPPVPLKGNAPVSESLLASSPLRPPMLPHLSMDTATDDEESDRLRKDIVRTLSPEKDPSEAPQNTGLEVPDQSSNRSSGVIPSEYDTYWEGARPDGSRYSQMPGEVEVGPRGVEMMSERPEDIPEEASPAPTEKSQRPAFLDKRFSWERSKDSGDFADIVGTGAGATAAGAGAAELAAHEPEPEGSKPAQPHYPVPEISTSGAMVTDVTSPSAMPEHASPERTMSPPHGLRVINETGHEEAVDIPPRLQTPQPEEEPSAQKVEPLTGETIAEHEPLTAQEPFAEQEPKPIEEKDLASEPQPVHISPVTTQQKHRLVPFREIAAIPNPTERIKVLNSSREQWAEMDTGLRGWLSTTMTTHPEHSNLLSQQPFTLTSRPTSGPGGRIGHRASPSISKFTNMLSPTSPHQSQNLDTMTTQQGSSSGPSGGTSGHRPGGASVGAKMGKELLTSAGALGGKATTGAKGLFAKGRSRFRGSGGGDKGFPSSTASDSSTHSSQVEPLARAMTQPAEETSNKRRMSPFRRLSRPSSVAISEGDSIPEIPTEPLPKSSHGTSDSKTDGSGTSTPKKRRLSPFRRLSRPSSTVNPDEAAGIPDMPKDPFPQRSVTMPIQVGEPELVHASTKETESRARRIFSGFRRNSRPNSIAVPSNDTFMVPGLPGHDISIPAIPARGDRRASYAFGSASASGMPDIVLDRRASYAPGQIPPIMPPAPDIFGGPPEKGEEKKEERAMSRLGVLPTPTHDAFNVSHSEPPSPTAEGDADADAAPNQTIKEDIEHEPEVFASPQPRIIRTDLSTEDAEDTRHSKLIDSIVRHASPPLQAIESRRQSRVYETELPLPNLGQVSGAPTPRTERGDPLGGSGAASISSARPVTATEESQEPMSKEPETNELEIQESEAPEHEEESLQPEIPAAPGVQREESKSSRPDVSPISDEGRESKDAVTRKVEYGERKAGWLDVSDDEEERDDEKQKREETAQDEVPTGELEKEAEMLAPSRASTVDTWERVSHQDAGSVKDEKEENEEVEEPQRENWQTPAEEREVELDDEDSLYGGAAPKPRIPPRSDSRPTQPGAERGVQPSNMEVGSIPQLQVPEQAVSRDVQGERHVVHEPDVDDLRKATIEEQAHEPLAPPPPSKIPDASIPNQQIYQKPSVSPLLPPVQAERMPRPSFPVERPMSFVPLPRDSSGNPGQEQINQLHDMIQEESLSPPQVQQPPAVQQEPRVQQPRARPPIPQTPIDRQEITQHVPQDSSPTEPRNVPRRATHVRRNSRQLEGPPPPPKDDSIPRVRQPQQPGQQQAFQGISEQPFSRQVIDPRQHTGAEYQLPGVGPPNVSPANGKPPSRTGFLRGPSRRESPAATESQANTRINPQLVAPPNLRGLSSTSISTVPPATPNESSKGRKGSLWSSFTRPGTAGADSIFTTDSTMGQAGDSPTRIHYLSQVERQREEQKPAKGIQKKASKKLERAATNADGGEKKKRFSSLGSIFGRSGTTGHAPKKLQKIAEKSTPSPPVQQRHPPPQPVPQPAPRPHTSHTSSVRTWRGLRAAQSVPEVDEQDSVGPRRERVSPAGGYYAPEGFGHSPGATGFDAIAQQQTSPVEYRQRQSSLPGMQPQPMVYNNGTISPARPQDSRRLSGQQQLTPSPYGASPARASSTGPYGQLSPHASGASSGVSSLSPNSMGSGAPPTRANSSPAIPGQSVWGRRPHAPRMPSIGEDGRHQERPWAIALPEGPEHEDDGDRRDSIQYAMMVRQQMARQEAMLNQQQYYPPPEETTYSDYPALGPHDQGFGEKDDGSRRNSMQYAMAMRQQRAQQNAQQRPQYYTPTLASAYQEYPPQQDYPAPQPRSQEYGHGHGQAQSPQSPQQHGQVPTLYLDPQIIARRKMEAQEQARARELELQRQEEAQVQSPHPLQSPQQQQPQMYAYPPPQHSIAQPRPQHPQEGYDPYAQQPYQGHGMPGGMDPSTYPLPMSPGGITSPINPMATQLPPPPPPKIPLQHHPLQQQQPAHYQPHSPRHQRYPSSDPPAYDPQGVLPPQRPRPLPQQSQPRGPQRRSMAADEEEEQPVMHAVSYPGMEWAPRWEEY